MITRLLLCYTWKGLSKDRQLTIFLLPIQFLITKNIENHLCISVKSRPCPAYWQSGTHLVRARLIVTHRVQPQEPQTFWNCWEKAAAHPWSGNLLVASQTSASLSNVMDTIGSCSGHLKYSINTASLRPYSINSSRGNSSQVRKAVATIYAASRGNRSVGHPFYRLYWSSRTTEKSFLPIYKNWSHRHGWKRNFWWVFDCSIERWT